MIPRRGGVRRAPQSRPKPRGSSRSRASRSTVAHALEELGRPGVGQGLGQLVAPGLVLGLQGAELGQGRGPSLRPRRRPGRPLFLGYRPDSCRNTLQGGSGGAGRRARRRTAARPAAAPAPRYRGGPSPRSRLESAPWPRSVRERRGQGPLADLGSQGHRLPAGDGPGDPPTTEAADDVELPGGVSRCRSAASSAASASRTWPAGRSNRAASRRAIVAQRGGLRFEGLVAGQASHVSTRRSAPSVRSRRATDVAVWRDS